MVLRYLYRRVLVPVLAAILVVSSLFVQAQTSDNRTITISSGEWIPFTGQKLKNGGFCTYILQKALSGYALNIEYMPWKRAMLMAKNGEFDATPCWIPAPQRDEDFIFTDPIMVQKKVFFHRKDLRFDWYTLNDLKPYKIGAALGYSYGEELDKAFKQGDLNVEFVVEDTMNLRKLMLGRIDLYPIELLVGYTILFKEFPAPQVNLITNHPKEVTRSTYHLLISKQIDPERARRIEQDFNAGMERLRENGEMAEIERMLVDGYFNP